VKEQSHKDEMSKALRGDFERLRDRGVATTLAPKDDAPHEPVAADVVAAAPVIEPEPSTQPEPEPAPEPEVETAPEPPADAPAAGADEPRGSWLDRLLGR